ncbi:MAG TPA: fluoride efflux transporter CrcB, partial [Rhizobiales bacterium]|nr:fluoride efflux transporter CrcB [Hyphomicrobiales bacterium]
IALRYSVSNEIRTFLATGVLGGFTTFSAFSLDFAVLMERRDEGLAAVYLGASVGLSILALFAGLYVARTILQ